MKPLRVERPGERGSATGKRRLWGWSETYRAFLILSLLILGIGRVLTGAAGLAFIDGFMVGLLLLSFALDWVDPQDYEARKR